MHRTADTLAVAAADLHAVRVRAATHPGFPTDTLPQFTALTTLAEATSEITDDVHPARFGHVAGLVRMGARIERVSDRTIRVRGPTPLRGADADADGIRETAALVMAALAASGVSEIHRIGPLYRGYERRFIDALIDGADSVS